MPGRGPRAPISRTHLVNTLLGWWPPRPQDSCTFPPRLCAWVNRHTSEMVGGVVLDFRGLCDVAPCPAEPGSVISRDHSGLVKSGDPQAFKNQQQKPRFASMPHPAFNQTVGVCKAFDSPIKLYFVRLDPPVQSADLFGSLTHPQGTGSWFQSFQWFRAPALR